MRLIFLAVFISSSSLVAQTAEHRLETLLLLPQPKFMRTALSVSPEGAKLTVLSPAQEISVEPGIMVYTAEQFKKLGLSVETFAERAKKTADKQLSRLKPELIKDSEGNVLYAVFRNERPIIASLLIAPTLPEIFEELFGPEIWVILPDRHSLFIFRAKPEALEEFTTDLATRFRDDHRAASPEIFAIKKGAAPRVVGSFVE